MNKKEKCLSIVNNAESILKEKIRETWTQFERKEIKKRGEAEADFYQIWYQLCKLETMKKWVNVHGYLTRSQRIILKEYIGERKWKIIMKG